MSATPAGTVGDPGATDTFRVLLYAHVDLNVIDGSAFFVGGAASLLTSAAGVEVDVVTATAIHRPVVVHEMLVADRVTVTDPFADQALVARLPQLGGATRMDERTAALVLAHYLDQGRHDVVLVRSTEVATALARLRPGLATRLCVYVTGVAFADEDVPQRLRARLQGLVDGGATLLCQTPEMLEHLERVLRVGDTVGGLAVMSPAVPAEPGAAPPAGSGPLVLAYTGKFAPAWHTVEMLAAVKQAVSGGADLRLVVAGDHFKRPPEWPTFGAEVRYLLGSHPSITWVGAVTRTDARALVTGADAGLGWRHPSLDTSLELSTKLLEHGALGRGCVINPTAMHRRLFGADYPLYARTTTDVVDLLRRMAADRGLVRDAAQTAMAVAEAYTYGRVLDQVLPTLVAAAIAAEPGRPGLARGVAALLAGPGRLVEHDGWSVAWLTDGRDAARVLARVGALGRLGDVERWGPVVRWRGEAEAGLGPAALDLVAALLVPPTGPTGSSGPSGSSTGAVPPPGSLDRGARRRGSGAPGRAHRPRRPRARRRGRGRAPDHRAAPAGAGGRAAAGPLRRPGRQPPRSPAARVLGPAGRPPRRSRRAAPTRAHRRRGPRTRPDPAVSSGGSAIGRWSPVSAPTTRSRT